VQTALPGTSCFADAEYTAFPDRLPAQYDYVLVRTTFEETTDVFVIQRAEINAQNTINTINTLNTHRGEK